MSKKCLFFLAITSAERVGELNALVIIWPCMHWWSEHSALTLWLNIALNPRSYEQIIYYNNKWYVQKIVWTLQYSWRWVCSVPCIQYGTILDRMAAILLIKLFICHRWKTQEAPLSEQSLDHWMLDAKLLPKSIFFFWALLGGHSKKSRELVLRSLDMCQGLFSFRTNTHLLRTCWESSMDRWQYDRSIYCKCCILCHWKDSACLCTHSWQYPGDSYYSWQLPMVYRNTFSYVISSIFYFPYLPGEVRING